MGKHNRRRGCLRKKAHPTRETALAKRADLEQRHHLPEGALTVYECQHCGAWHVGHQIGHGGRRK